ncbi:hypothetical protein ADEAN_000041700 [Angomonas deanei]|uniref:Uncharacterized protein n=1 Tax=Angomonas deanei TaxID=59799 RepID=A0A7G2C199_9TRYP|nr:hypothetical protein ADEAN_000041700 [Angomonas deanei]
MIHTEAPLEGGEPHGELTTTTTSETDAVAWCSSDRQRCTRRDLPWLRRRAYQAHCERHLLRLQCSVECTDLWLDHLPEQDYLNSLRRLVDALMENRLWREAFNLTLLAGKDTVGVLCLWAVDLLRNGVSQYKDGLTSPAFHTYHEWTLVVDYCRELCQLRPKYNAVASIPFRRVLITAYLCDYTRTPRKLIEAFANVDLYGCTVTCLDICTNLRGRSDRSALLDVEDSESIAHEGGQTEDVVVYHDVEVPAHTWDTEILPWLVLLEAVRYGYMLLTGNDTRGNSVLPIQTALFDTIAAYTKEFLENQSSRALVMGMVPDASDVARRFLTAM